MALRKKLGEILLEQGLITTSQLDEALVHQKVTKKKLGETLVVLNYLTKEQIVEGLAQKFSLPIMEFIDGADAELPMELKEIVPKKVAKQRIIFPLERRDSTLYLVMADPLDYRAIDDISFSTKLRISPIISYESSILDAIERYYVEGGDSTELLDMFSSNISVDKEIFFSETPREEADVNIDALYSKSKAPPIVKLVAMIIAEAAKSRASDIHIEPRRRNVQVRFRIDGDLRNIFTYDKNIHDSVISRVKIISTLDITNRRLPQDGSCHVTMQDREIDLRISTIPAIYGEKVVIRLLNQSTGIVPIDELGMPAAIRESIVRFFRQPQGMLIVTGPTGSGKTTTLYACINQLKSDTRNTVTIEDPVEYKIDGVTQIQTHEDIGRGFANVLRSVLRQDPDVILVGEVRDPETSEIAVKASLTGHLVLTTLHTNSTVATITRMLDLGVPAYLIASSVSGILAQRLVKRICPNCRTEADMDSELVGVIRGYGLRQIKRHYYGTGCEKCMGSGYFGRVAVYEFLPFSSGFKLAFSKSSDEVKLLQAAKKEGVVFLPEDAWNKVEEGVTTIEEVLTKIPLDYCMNLDEPEPKKKAVRKSSQ